MRNQMIGIWEPGLNIFKMTKKQEKFSDLPDRDKDVVLSDGPSWLRNQATYQIQVNNHEAMTFIRWNVGESAANAFQLAVGCIGANQVEI